MHLSQGRNYVDREGHSKQFTVIDWDKKTKVSAPMGSHEENVKEWEQSKKDTIARITAINPVFAGPNYAYLLKRGENVEKLEWNMLALEVLVQDSYNSYLLEKELEINVEKYGNY